MINVNENTMQWAEDLSVSELLKKMGYKLKKPSVLFRVNGEIIRRENWEGYCIPDNAEITVLNLLRGG